jgi:hypothetical protein
MAVLDIHWNPSSRQLRQFAVLQAIFFTAVAAGLYHRTGSAPSAAILLAASLLAALLGLALPSWLRWIFVGWILVAFPVGWLVSHALLAALFYLVFTPIAAMMKVCGYDPMQRRPDRQATSYWKPRPPQDDTERYFKQY